MSDTETIPRPDEKRVLTVDQEVEARELAQRIEETKAQNPAKYDKLLAETVRGNRDVANAAFQLVDDNTADDMIRHVEKMREGQERGAEPDTATEARSQPREADGPVKDREDVLDDRAEELNRKTVTAMRDGLSGITDPAKLAAAQKIIEKMEAAGREFRADREADDRDSAHAPKHEAERPRDADTERQTRDAAARAAADRDTATQQAVADRTSRNNAGREAGQVEREAERGDDDRDR